VRLRGVRDTTGHTLLEHIHRFTQAGGTVFVDEFQSYNHLLRPNGAVTQGSKE
jgi:hypothetical protein